MRCIAIAAVTIDGKIALDANSGSSWTSPEDKDFLHEMLDKADVVVVGNNTYKAAIEPLMKRNCVVLTRSVGGLERAHDKLAFVNPELSDLRQLLEPYDSVAILGGASTYAYCLEHNLLDELFLTIEPLIFGKGIDLFAYLQAETHCVLLSTKKLNEKGSLLLHYKIVRS